METERIPRRGGVAATALLSGLLLVPGLRLPPDTPPASPAPAPRASAPPATPAPAPAAPRPAPTAPPFTVPPPPPPPPPPPSPAPPAATPEATAAPTNAPGVLENTGVAMPPGTGGTPAPGPRPAHELAVHEPPGTVSDVPPAVPWALLPGLSLLLGALAFGLLRLAGWPGRMLGTARLAMAAPVPAEPATVALGAAAQRLPAAIQRDLAELAVLLEEEGLTAPE